MTAGRYIFDASHATERDRLRQLTAFFEPGTRRLLETVGVTLGWRCLEVGTGVGTTAEWLAERVGPAGHVTATDIDLRLAEGLRRENVELRHHDIVSDPLEEAAFDLAHARLLLMHLPERVAALHKIVAAVKPGGWVVIEDFDFRTWGHFDPPSEVQQRSKAAVAALFERAQIDTELGLRLPRMLTGAGMEDVRAEGRCGVNGTGSATFESMALMLLQQRDRLVASGLISSADIDAAIAEARSGEARWGYSPIMVAAWGRRR